MTGQSNGHNKKIYDNCRFSADLEVHSPQQPRCFSTGIEDQRS
jgi:hypothetical protein